MSNGWGGGSGGGAMPPEPWLFACGFRVIIGKLITLSPTQIEILICGEPGKQVTVTFEVGPHTTIIGLDPVNFQVDGVTPIYHKGELVQVNLMATSNIAVSVERYFSNVRHTSNATGGSNMA